MYLTGSEGLRTVAKPRSPARGQRRLQVSSTKLLDLGRAGFGGFLHSSGSTKEMLLVCCQLQGLSLQTEESCTQPDAEPMSRLTPALRPQPPAPLSPSKPRGSWDRNNPSKAISLN